MTYTLNEIKALCRLFLFHTRTSYSVKEMRAKVKSDLIGFTRCEIKAEIEANDNDLG